MRSPEMGAGMPEQKSPEEEQSVQDFVQNEEGLSMNDENNSFAFLEIYGIDTFLSRLNIPLVKQINDFANIYSIDELTAYVSDENKDRLRKAIIIVSNILKEAKNTPDEVFPEDEDIKYKDVLENNTLAQALFARMVKIRLNKKN